MAWTPNKDHHDCEVGYWRKFRMFLGVGLCFTSLFYFLGLKIGLSMTGMLAIIFMVVMLIKLARQEVTVNTPIKRRKSGNTSQS